MEEKNLEQDVKVKKILKNLTVHDFRNFGLHQIAYIRQHDSENFVIYAADGSEVCHAKNFDDALSKARVKNLETVIVH